MAEGRRVVVTGLGAVSPFGAGVKAYWAGLAAGSCAIRPLTPIDAEGFRCRIAAESLTKVQNDFIHKLTEDATDNHESMMDSEFMLAEFVDRFGPRMAHLGGMHYHYRPEIFLQIHGRTEFRCPREHFELRPGEICIIPAGVPHAESVFGDVDRPFRNLVAGFYNNSISIHFAHEATPQHPDIEVIQFFDAPNLDGVINAFLHAELLQLVNLLLQLGHLLFEVQVASRSIAFGRHTFA